MLVVQRGLQKDGFDEWMADPAILALDPGSLQRLEQAAREQLSMMKKWMVKMEVAQLRATVALADDCTFHIVVNNLEGRG